MASAVDASAADASRRRLTLTAVSVVGTLVFGRMRRKRVDVVDAGAASGRICGRRMG